MNAARSNGARRFATAIIVVFLFFQGASTFKVLCPPVDPNGRLGFLRIACDPQLWPFMQYPMYSIPHYPGDQVSMYAVVGRRADLTEVPISAADLGISFWHYQTFAEALLENNETAIREYADVYERRHNTQLIGLQLVDRPWILETTGPRQGDRIVLAEIELGD